MARTAGRSDLGCAAMCLSLVRTTRRRWEQALDVKGYRWVSYSHRGGWSERNYAFMIIGGGIGMDGWMAHPQSRIRSKSWIFWGGGLIERP